MSSSAERLKSIKERSKLRRQLLAQQLGAKDVKEIGSILGGQEDVKPGTDPKDEVTSPLPLKKRDADKAFRLPGVPTKGPKVLITDGKKQVSKGNESDEETFEEVYTDSSTFLKKPEVPDNLRQYKTKGTQSLNPHNDYCQHFVDTLYRPQNFIRDTGLADRFEEYPKLKELIRLKKKLIIPYELMKCFGVIKYFLDRALPDVQVVVHIESDLGLSFASCNIYLNLHNKSIVRLGFVHQVYAGFLLSNPSQIFKIDAMDEIIAQRATPPMYLRCDLETYDLRDLNCKFDVILVEPPIEEYQRRCPGLTFNWRPWEWEEIMKLEIGDIAAQRSFVFVWCGSHEGLDWGRKCLRAWGFRRCEDICWIKTNKDNPGNTKYMEPNAVLQHTKEHCLMGIKGTVRRSTDGDFIHANVDLDIIITEEPEFGSMEKPAEIFHIIEHFCLGRRRLHVFGNDSTLRPGWLTVGPDLSSSNFSSETYNSYFSNGPDDYLVGCTPEIETLRPKSPPLKNKNPQQPGGRGGGRGAGRGVGRGGPPEQGIATIPVIRGRGVPGPLDVMPRGGGFAGRGMPFIPRGGYQPR